MSAGASRPGAASCCCDGWHVHCWFWRAHSYVPWRVTKTLLVTGGATTSTRRRGGSCRSTTLVPAAEGPYVTLKLLFAAVLYRPRNSCTSGDRPALLATCRAWFSRSWAVFCAGLSCCPHAVAPR